MLSKCFILKFFRKANKINSKLVVAVVVSLLLFFTLVYLLHVGTVDNIYVVGVLQTISKSLFS